MSKLLRLFLLAAILALPQLGQAQLNTLYPSGTYTLASDSSRHLVGKLRLKTQQQLLVTTPAGRMLRLKPDEVGSFKIGPRTYTVVRDFVVVQGSQMREVRAAFAEQLSNGRIKQQLSNGRIKLWRYTHRWNTGSDWLFLYHYPLSFYLVASTGPHLAAIYDQGSPETFRQQMRTLLHQRPDLLHLLEEGRLTYANLPAAIRALNADTPFYPAATTNPK